MEGTHGDPGPGLPMPLRRCDWDNSRGCRSPAAAELSYPDRQRRWLCERHARVVVDWHRVSSPAPALGPTLRWLDSGRTGTD